MDLHCRAGSRYYDKFSLLLLYPLWFSSLSAPSFNSSASTTTASSSRTGSRKTNVRSTYSVYCSTPRGLCSQCTATSFRTRITPLLTLLAFLLGRKLAVLRRCDFYKMSAVSVTRLHPPSGTWLTRFPVKKSSIQTLPTQLSSRHLRRNDAAKPLPSVYGCHLSLRAAMRCSRKISWRCL